MEPLTQRQAQVLELAGWGFTDAQIAEQLIISQHTVTAHLRNARERLRAANTTQAVVMALLTGQIKLASFAPLALSI